jgi:hypothetical protein
MRNQANYFSNLRERLTSIEGLRALTTNVRTAGVRLELFTLGQVPENTSLISRLYGVLSQPDAIIKSVSGGRVDVAGLTVLALTGMGISQIVKGQGLPAGWTLLWNAANLVRDAGTGHAPEQPPHPAKSEG